MPSRCRFSLNKLGFRKRKQLSRWPLQNERDNGQSQRCRSQDRLMGAGPARGISGNPGLDWPLGAPYDWYNPCMSSVKCGYVPTGGTDVTVPMGVRRPGREMEFWWLSSQHSLQQWPPWGRQWVVENRDAEDNAGDLEPTAGCVCGGVPGPLSSAEKYL